MYSEKIKNIKQETMNNLEVDSAKIFNELDNFCTADDLVGAPCSKVIELFGEYCAENKKNINLSYTKFGIAACRKFNLKTKTMRIGDEVVRVYRRK